MRDLLYLIAIVFVIAWLIGFVGLHIGGLIHLLLVIAVVSLLLRIIGGSDPV